MNRIEKDREPTSRCRRPRRPIHPRACGERVRRPSEPRGEPFDWEAFVGDGRSRNRSIVGGILGALGVRPTADRVDEVLQEAFLRMLSTAGFAEEAAGRSRVELEAYLRRVTRAVVVDDLRRRTAEKRGGRGRVEMPLEEADDQVDEEEDPEARLLAEEQRRELRCRLRAALPPGFSRRSRRLLERVVLDGERTCDVVQGSESWTRGAAYVALHRMRRALVARGREMFLS